MRHLFALFGMDKEVEVLVIIILGTISCGCDQGLFHIKTDLNKIWDATLDIRYYPIMMQFYLKYLMVGILAIRAFTNHVFIALYIPMLWPALMLDRPNVMLPWLFLGIFRIFVANIASLTMGTFICFTHEGLNWICLEYVLSQFIQYGPSVYAWFVVLSFYKELKEDLVACELYEKEKKERKIEKRKWAKSIRLNVRQELEDEIDNGRNLISESTIDAIMQHLKTTLSESRSLDALLANLAAADVEEEILNCLEEEEEEEEDDTSIVERAKKFLNIIPEEIEKIRSQPSRRTLRILSEITLDALSLVDSGKYLAKISHTSFFLKNGVICRGPNQFLEDDHQIQKKYLKKSEIEFSVLELDDIINKRKSKIDLISLEGLLKKNKVGLTQSRYIDGEKKCINMTKMDLEEEKGLKEQLNEQTENNICV